MSMIKYRIHEVAKDFNVSSKVISQILTDYVAAPKNHMQVLENHELNVIFDYMTQHNQAASLEEIFKVPAKTEPAKPAPAKQQAAQEKKPENKGGKAGGEARRSCPVRSRRTGTAAGRPGEEEQTPCASPGGGEAGGGHPRRRGGEH